MIEIEKSFDAVQMMRSIRHRINEEISGMTFEEQQAYIHERLQDETIARFCNTGSEGSPPENV